MKRSIPLLATVLASLAAPNVLAEAGGAPQGPGQGAAPGPAQQAPATANVSEKELRQFVKAEEKVLEVREKYADKVSAASDDPDKAMAIQQKAQQKMVEAVQDSGMEVQAFNRIVQLASADPKIMKRLQELR